MGDTRLQGKVAVVTGGGRGIGRAISLGYGRAGARVVVNYTEHRGASEEVVEAIRRDGGQAIAVQADVSSKDQVDKLVRKTVENFGRIDILVNNAGICPFADFLDISEDAWTRVQDVNLKGAFLCSQAVARTMVEFGVAGSIIMISSISSIVGGPQQAHYCPTKAGMNLLMKSMAISLGKYGIRCNAIGPGTIATDINQQQLSSAMAREEAAARVPLGRLGTPDDLVGPAIFLASDEAAYVNGTLLIVDGGTLARI